MQYLLTIFLIFHLLTSVMVNSMCRGVIWKRKKGEEKSGKFECTELTHLRDLDKALTKTTSIQITDSKIPVIGGHTFARFGASLVTLDLHNSGIENIEHLAFVGLTKLQNLILWGNKLKMVPRDWFVNAYNLKTLDLSFNFIEVIDYGVFSLLPNLENFYFDYNQIKYIDYSMFAYLTNLKNVKFEKNPLQWGYRAHLTWQLENQHVKFPEEWENWKWMNVVIKECTEAGHGEIPKDTVLDCVVGKLLDFAREIFSSEWRQQNDSCSREARRLVSCTRPTNSTGNTDNETVRRILEDYTTVLIPMSKSQGGFSKSPYYG